ncbi:UPF0711 protein C18orf21 homolog [Nerophis lumbriciformis]|uniref:UPF0711 protein C18orf21 homolog n=1 Tax=Nerophis lumbriciformis TaxID=546530 RepID=UPI002ADF4763|nr:UPF0711 protein C18orf21 homolog [Nerophis lumbriciformis]
MTPSNQKNLSDKFRLNASQMFKDSCPEASRYFLTEHFTQMETGEDVSPPAIDQTAVCEHCYQWRRPDNHRVRLRPKRQPSVRLQRVLRRRARGKTLSLAHRRLLNRFQKSASVLMATCHTCNKTSRHRGLNREFLPALAKRDCAPGSAGKRAKTPQSANRAPATTPKTPSHTPRSSHSSTPASASSSSSKASRAKTWVVQRLSKILSQEDKPSSKKGSLKDFLSSL